MDSFVCVCVLAPSCIVLYGRFSGARLCTALNPSNLTLQVPFDIIFVSDLLQIDSLQILHTGLPHRNRLHLIILTMHRMYAVLIYAVFSILSLCQMSFEEPCVCVQRYDHVSHSYKLTSKIVILQILTFNGLQINLRDGNFELSKNKHFPFITWHCYYPSQI